MTSFFNPHSYDTCLPWTGRDAVWSPPLPRLIEEQAHEAVSNQVAALYADQTLYVCGFSPCQLFLDNAHHPGGPFTKRYAMTVVVQERIDHNGAPADDENGGEE